MARDQNNQLKYLDLSVASGGGGGGGQLPGPWEMTLGGGTASFTNCCARIARAYYFFDDQSVNVPATGDVMVYMGVDHTPNPQVHVLTGNYQSARSLLSGMYSNCISATITPLYRITDGAVRCDYRCLMNIQAYDNRNYSSYIPYW